MESVLQVEKKTLPQAIDDVSEFVCVTALDGRTRRPPISVSGFANVNAIPFRQLVHRNALFQRAFAVGLGSTDPHTTAVHVEPFSTSVFKVLT